MLVMGVMSGQAATYYVSPEGSGAKDGSSVDNAFGVAEFSARAADNSNGDIYYFAGGTYIIPTTVVFKVGTGATLYGNAEGDRTVFSGDLNDNAYADADDAGRLVRFQANTVHGNSANAILISNIDFTCVYTNTDDSSNNAGALAIDNSGDVLVENCNFYDNWAQGQQGGAAAFLYRSTVKFEGCTFSGNKANYRGGAIRINSNANTKGLITFENCVIKNNLTYHDLGGAIFAANFNSINIVNSTVYGNCATQGRGAAIYFNGKNGDYPRLLRVVNSTIAGNTVGEDVEADGQIGSTQAANIYVANSIIPSSGNCGSIFLNGAEASEDFLVESGGFNYVGNVESAVEVEIAWKETDHVGEGCIYSDIFGENIINSDGVVIPVKFYAGATGAEVTAATADWDLSEGLALTADQLGNPRSGEVCMGALALTSEQIKEGEGDNSGVEDTVAASDETVTVYNLMGVAVKRDVKWESVVGNLPTGVYIVNGRKVLIR